MVEGIVVARLVAHHVHLAAYEVVVVGNALKAGVVVHHLRNTGIVLQQRVHVAVDVVGVKRTAVERGIAGEILECSIADPVAKVSLCKGRIGHYERPVRLVIDRGGDLLFYSSGHIDPIVQRRRILAYRLAHAAGGLRLLADFGDAAQRVVQGIAVIIVFFLLGILAHDQPSELIVPEIGLSGIGRMLSRHLPQAVVAVIGRQYVRQHRNKAVQPGRFYAAEKRGTEVGSGTFGRYGFDQISGLVVVVQGIVVLFIGIGDREFLDALCRQAFSTVLFLQCGKHGCFLYLVQLLSDGHRHVVHLLAGRILFKKADGIAERFGIVADDVLQRTGIGGIVGQVAGRRGRCCGFGIVRPAVLHAGAVIDEACKRAVFYRLIGREVGTGKYGPCIERSRKRGFKLGGKAAELRTAQAGCIGRKPAFKKFGQWLGLGQRIVKNLRAVTNLVGNIQLWPKCRIWMIGGSKIHRGIPTFIHQADHKSVIAVNHHIFYHTCNVAVEVNLVDFNTCFQNNLVLCRGSRLIGPSNCILCP